MKLLKKELTVQKIREFNRFYMPKLDLLNKSYLKSDYSQIEARIIFELVENEVCYAYVLIDKLKIDKSYLSRILKKFEKNELITRKVSNKDARFYNIVPTSKCFKTYEELSEKSNNRAKELLLNLTDDECEKIITALDTITEILSED